MKKLLFVAVLFAPTMLYAQSAFTGTWRFSPQSAQFSGKPDTFSIENGMYRCDSCVPQVEVKADGQDHERKGSPYSDMLSVRVVDDHTIELVNKKGGKVVSTEKDTVSPDGKTLTSEWSFVSENGTEGHGKGTETRVADAPEGAHKASGSWRPEKIESTSENVMLVTFTATDDGLSMSDPTGESYTAKFDGKDYPYKGNPGITSVSLKKIDANTIEETDKRDGKVIYISRMTISPDGRSMIFENHDALHDTNAKFEAKKQ
jgi:hypothetical protein